MPKIDLYYHRPGCISCKRAREIIDSVQTPISTERQSKMQPLTDTDAQTLLESVSNVIVARGKATESLKSADATLDHLRGPTGGFRAPMIKVGKTLLVGFHPDAIRTLIAPTPKS